MATKKKPTMAAVSIEPSSPTPCRPPNARMVQNFHLVWLDGGMDENNNDDCRNSIIKLRQVVNTVNTFIDVDQCIDFITDIKEEKSFMIVSREFSESIIPVVQEIPQVSSVYIFCRNKTCHEKWAKEWLKIEGVYTDITPICEALIQATQDCDQNSISIGFVQTANGGSKQSLDTLDSSFMYTQILKEILLTIDFKQAHIHEFLTHCREQFVDNTIELRNVDKIEKEYHHHQPIWWYSYQCFLYSMLNRALRTMEIDLIIKMGFFVRDLHNHIAALHSEQYGRQNHSDLFILYRGQGLSHTDFDQLMKTQGGLLSFNNFLSTSKNRDVSLKFARRTIAGSNLVGIVFVMKIDPAIFATVPFANVGSVSCYRGEEEILFSMHSVFRIGQVKQIDGNTRLWQVELTLTSDNDPQLHALTERMREETKGSTGWYRLGELMMTLGQFNKAEELYEILLKQTRTENEKAHIFNNIGRITEQQGKYKEAITIFESSLEILRKTLPPFHSDLASSYNNIGMVYDKIGEFSKALSYYEKALGIIQKTLPANHLNLAASYNNIGGLYDRMGEHSKALSYFEKDLEILQKTLPATHPDLATSYNNMGLVYDSMGEYSKALSCHKKALEIRKKALPANHPGLAISYNNIGGVYYSMGDYSKALSFLERTLDIRQRSMPPDHPDIQGVRESIENVKKEIVTEFFCRLLENKLLK